MGRGKDLSSQKREIIDEEAELGPVAGPKRRSVNGYGEEDHMGPGATT